MNILYLGYWSVLDGLSEATIRPQLEVLAKLEGVTTIIYISIEREHSTVRSNWEIAGVKHLPYYSPSRPLLLDKIADFTTFPKHLIQLCVQYNIDKIICRSSPAGAIGYLVWKKTNIQYYVESFEPHAEYMLESGVWHKWGIRYWAQYYFEQRQKETATVLVTVSEGYKKYLQEVEGVKIPVEVLPCTVNLDKFKFNSDARKKIRHKLKIEDNAMVGIYVGKFGGIYYDREAFSFFRECFKKFDNFYLIILTSDNKEKVDEKLEYASCPITSVWVNKVAHKEVANYLSASDMAFCPVKSTPNRKYCSPIKNGEYWANGLPIIIPDGIGDDSNIIVQYGGGLIVKYDEVLGEAFTRFFFQVILDHKINRNANHAVMNAKMHRSSELIGRIYNSIFQLS